MSARLWMLSAVGGVVLMQAQQSPNALLIRDVTVIHAARSVPVLSHMDVLIRGNRIAEVLPTGSKFIDSGILSLDAKGKFLIPGLWDMHTHALRPERVSTWFPLFVVNGIVGIRDMGSPLPGREVQALKNGKVTPAPRIYAVGKILGGWIEEMGIAASTAEEGRHAVAEMHAAGSDFIKVYSLLRREVFLAVTDEARAHQLSVVGHVPLTISLADAAAAGLKSFEHGYGLLEACSTREAALRQRIERAASGASTAAAAWGAVVKATDRSYGEQAVVGGYSETKCIELSARLHSYAIWQCPTLKVREAFASLNDHDYVEAAPMKYILKSLRRQWAAALNVDDRSRGLDVRDFADRRVRLEQEGKMAALLLHNGVPLLAGTDCGNPYIVPGFSLHDELALLVQAGLSPLEALASATSEAARFLGQQDEFGTVEPGRRADLVLLNRDPLADIRNTRAIDSVILNGRLYDQSDLSRLLDQIEAAAR